MDLRSGFWQIPMHPNDAQLTAFTIPRKGQLEYQLFEEIFGMNWDEDVQLNIDPEVKITEFNYEEFIPAEIL